MRTEKERIDFDQKKLKKGQLLLVKVPPFYDKEYLYEISGAGGKQVRANLYHSPKVKKQWSFDDLELLFDNGMIRFTESAAHSHSNLESDDAELQITEQDIPEKEYR